MPDDPRALDHQPADLTPPLRSDVATPPAEHRSGVGRRLLGFGALLLLAGNGNQSKLHGFAGISQATLATMIGTTRSRVNFFLNRFRKLGFIGYHGRLDRNGGMHINTPLLRKAFYK